MPSSPSQRTPRTTWVNGLPTMPTTAYLVAEGISLTTGPGREGKRKDTEVSLEPTCGIGVCNEVWWRPYPTNLPPPSHHSPTPTHTCKRPPHLFSHKATSLPWAYGPPYSLSCGGQVPDVGIPHYRDARMQHCPKQTTSTPWGDDRSRAQGSASIH